MAMQQTVAPEPAGAAIAAGAARPGRSTTEPTMIVDQDEMRAIFSVPVSVQVVLGRTDMPVSQLLRLGRGAVVELNRKVGEAVDVYVNDRLIARGEIVIVDDGRLGVTMTEIVKGDAGFA